MVFCCRSRIIFGGFVERFDRGKMIRVVGFREGVFNLLGLFGKIVEFCVLRN